MHDPLGPTAVRGPANVKDEALPPPCDLLLAEQNRPVLTGGLPESVGGGAVGTVRAVVLPVDLAEEEPLLVASTEAGARRQLPRGAPVQLHFGDCVHAEGKPGDLASEVVADELLVRRVEAEPGDNGGQWRRRRRRQGRGCGGRTIHGGEGGN